MVANSALHPVNERGWRRGLGNLFHAEFAAWFCTSQWWLHALIWSAVLNVLLVGVLAASQAPAAGSASGSVPDAPVLFSVFQGLFVSVAVIIIMQGAIVGEKQAGTAAWILSKPVSRTAFIVSKLLPNAVGMVTTMLAIPAIVAFLQLNLVWGLSLPLGSYMAGVGVLALNMLFYLTLTVLMGTLFNRWGPVIAIPLGLTFGQQYLLGLLPPLKAVLPWSLAVPLGEDGTSIAGALMVGAAPPSWSPVFAVAVFIALFVTLAIWRFRREEL